MFEVVIDPRWGQLRFKDRFGYEEAYAKFARFTLPGGDVYAYPGTCYLAHPCRSPSEEENFLAATRLFEQLAERNVRVFSPVTHSVPAWQEAQFRAENAAPDAFHAIPDEYWFKIDLAVAGACDALLLAPGWEQSRGCQRELGWFEAWGRPVATVCELLLEDAPEPEEGDEND